MHIIHLSFLQVAGYLTIQDTEENNPMLLPVLLPFSLLAVFPPVKILRKTVVKLLYSNYTSTKQRRIFSWIPLKNKPQYQDPIKSLPGLLGAYRKVFG